MVVETKLREGTIRKAWDSCKTNPAAIELLCHGMFYHVPTVLALPSKHLSAWQAAHKPVPVRKVTFARHREIVFGIEVETTVGTFLGLTITVAGPTATGKVESQD